MENQNEQEIKESDNRRLNTESSIVSGKTNEYLSKFPHKVVSLGTNEYSWVDPKIIKTFPFSNIGLIELKLKKEGGYQKFFSTGILITPNLVLTSCHSIFPIIQNKRNLTKPEEIFFTLGYNSQKYTACEEGVNDNKFQFNIYQTDDEERIDTSTVKAKNIYLYQNYFNYEQKLKETIHNFTTDKENLKKGEDGMTVVDRFKQFNTKLRKAFLEKDFSGVVNLFELAGDKEYKNILSIIRQIESIKSEIVKNDYCFILLEHAVLRNYIDFDNHDKLIQMLMNEALLTRQHDKELFVQIGYTCYGYTTNISNFNSESYQYKHVYKDMNINPNEILMVYNSGGQLKQIDNDVLTYNSYMYPMSEGSPIFVIKRINDQEIEFIGLIGTHVGIHNKDFYSYTTEDNFNPMTKTCSKLNFGYIKNIIEIAEKEYLLQNNVIFSYNIKGTTGSETIGNHFKEYYEENKYKKLKFFNFNGMNFEAKGIENLIQAFLVLPFNKFITGFDFTGNTMGDEGMKILSEGLISANSKFENMKSINFLNFSKNGITDKGGVCIADLITSLCLVNLKELNISENALTYKGIEKVCWGLKKVKCVNLKKLILDDNYIENDGLKQVFYLIRDLRLVNLEVISLNNNHISNIDIIAEVFNSMVVMTNSNEKVSLFTKLKTFNIKGNNFNLDYLKSYFNSIAILSLSELDFSDEDLEQKGASIIKNFFFKNPINANRNLKIMNLSGCSLGDKGIEEIYKAFYYCYNIQENGFKIINGVLPNYSLLEELDISNNDITSIGCKLIFLLLRYDILKKLQKLDLSSNSLGVEISDYIIQNFKKKRLGELNSLDLNFNILPKDDIIYIAKLVKNNTVKI